jgi:hypothetical protein
MTVSQLITLRINQVGSLNRFDDYYAIMMSCALFSIWKTHSNAQAQQAQLAN